MFLLVWVAVNLHSNTEFWGCMCVSAQDQASLLNVLIFSGNLQTTHRANTLPSKAYLSSQHIPLGVDKKVTFPLQLVCPCPLWLGLHGSGNCSPAFIVLPEWNTRVVPWSPTTDASKTWPQAKITLLSLKVRYFNINFHLPSCCSYREDPAVQVWVFFSSVSNFRKSKYVLGKVKTYRFVPIWDSSPAQSPKRCAFQDQAAVFA